MITLPTPTVTTTVVGSGATALPVACIDPHPTPGRVYVIAMGYGAGLDPFEIQRFGLIAQHLRARLLIPEIPGCSYHARTRLSRAERIGLLRSDFHPAARRMLDAALTVDAEAQHDLPYGVLGYSLGASLAAAMADVAHDPACGTELSTVILVEPVANRRWSIPDILQSNRAEDRLIGEHLRRNNEVEGAVEPSGLVSGSPKAHLYLPDLLLLANALRAGRLFEDLRSAARKPYRLVVAHGRGSRMSRCDAARQLVDDCQGIGVAALNVEVDGRHGLWQSLPDVDNLATRIASALGTSA